MAEESPAGGRPPRAPRRLDGADTVRRAILGSVAVVVVSLTAAYTARAGVLPGDCNGDGRVTVSDLVGAVNVAIGNQPLSTCARADDNGDGQVSIDELIRAVNAALGIGATPTPTPELPGGVRVYDFSAVGGQPCTETFVFFDTPEELPFTISATVTDFCLDAAAFDVGGISCDSELLRIRTEFQDDCRLFDPIAPRGQVHITAFADDGQFDPGSDLIGCSIPVRIQAVPGDYTVRYRVAATTSQGDMLGYGETTINVLALDPVPRVNSRCCESDDQCQSGFCRGGDNAEEHACCPSDCANGICNDVLYAGACCDPSRLPDRCVILE